jgi:hypothetical protein
MSRRLTALLVLGVLMGTMLALSAGAALADHRPGHPPPGGGGGDFKTFCDEQGGTFADQGTPGASDDTCTTVVRGETRTITFENRTKEAGQSGRGFDQQGEQDVTPITTTVLDKKNDPDPEIKETEERSEPRITGCTNPGDKPVSTTNPNCQANTPGQP